jgi:hypothetical protein
MFLRLQSIWILCTSIEKRRKSRKRQRRGNKMGFFGLFKRKSKDVLDAALADEEEEEALERAEEQELLTERAYINKIQFAYDKKSKLIRAMKAYTTASKTVVNGLRRVWSAKSQLWLAFKALPTFAKAGVQQTARRWVEKEYGTKLNKESKSEMLANSLFAEIQMIDKKLGMTLASENPKLLNAKKMQEVIREQNGIMRAYNKLLQKEFNQNQQIIKDIMDEQKKLAQAHEQLEKERAEIQTRLAKRSA